MVDSSHIPAKQEIIDDSIHRIFSDDVEPSELKWHWDEADRIVTVLNESDWQYQTDNQFPIKLSQGKIISIKAGEWHRVIKGKTNLEVMIKEKAPEN